MLHIQEVVVEAQAALVVILQVQLAVLVDLA